MQQTCPHPNACLTCDSFLTTDDSLISTATNSREPEQLITQAEADGRRRLVEINEPVRLDLVVHIIDGLETLEVDDGR